MSDVNEFVSGVTQEFEIRDGCLSMPPDIHRRWFDKISSVPRRQRAALAEAMLALAAKFFRLGGADAKVAIIQLGDLAAAALENSELLAKMFMEAGMDLRDAAARIGTESSSRPVSTASAPGSVSLFALRISSDKK